MCWMVCVCVSKGLSRDHCHIQMHTSACLCFFVPQKKRDHKNSLPTEKDTPALWKYDLESKFRQRAFDRVRPYDKLNLFRNNTDSICTSVNPCVLLLWGFWNGISFFVVPDKRFRFATFLRSLRYYEVSVRPAHFSTFSNDKTTSIGLGKSTGSNTRCGPRVI